MLTTLLNRTNKKITTMESMTKMQHEKASSIAVMSSGMTELQFAKASLMEARLAYEKSIKGGNKIEFLIASMHLKSCQSAVERAKEKRKNSTCV